MCPNGPNGHARQEAPYFSNPNVFHEGVPTGDSENNNAGYMTEKRFEFRDAGSNCLDGFPDEGWMNFEADGKIGNNCPNGETSFEPSSDKNEGMKNLLFTKINC